jgi:hypothetical protein
MELAPRFEEGAVAENWYNNATVSRGRDHFSLILGAGLQGAPYRLIQFRTLL